MVIRDDLAMSPLAHAEVSDESDLPAGDFSAWVTLDAGCAARRAIQRAVRRMHRLLHVIPVHPHRAGRDRDAVPHPGRADVPRAGLPSGHVVLGYDEHGHCPMLIDGQCSIYDHRPATCRTYDCRIFPAAGLRIDDDDKVLIDRRAQRWRFSYPTPADHTRHAAVRAAAIFLDDHPDLLPRSSGLDDHATRRPGDRTARCVSSGTTMRPTRRRSSSRCRMRSASSSTRRGGCGTPPESHSQDGSRAFVPPIRMRDDSEVRFTSRLPGVQPGVIGIRDRGRCHQRTEEDP